MGGCHLHQASSLLLPDRLGIMYGGSHRPGYPPCHSARVPPAALGLLRLAVLLAGEVCSRQVRLLRHVGMMLLGSGHGPCIWAAPGVLNGEGMPLLLLSTCCLPLRASWASWQGGSLSLQGCTAPFCGLPPRGRHVEVEVDVLAVIYHSLCCELDVAAVVLHNRHLQEW
jgi:hypothetical protein